MVFPSQVEIEYCLDKDLCKGLNMKRPVNIHSEVKGIKAHWTPKHVLTLNASHSLKLASIKGEFIWHSHPETDEVFCQSLKTLICFISLQLDLGIALTNLKEDEPVEVIWLTSLKIVFPAAHSRSNSKVDKRLS